VTLDAMHWVWDQSHTKGNARIAMLYVADQVRTPACEVRVGQRELMRALNTPSKDTAEKALKAAVQLGELQVLESGTGRRPALYKLPKAVGFVRQSVRSAPESGAQGFRSAPVSGRSAPESGAPPHSPKELATPEAGKPDAFQICQPLITAMTQAGITVSWSMQPKDWLEIADIVERAGIAAMVSFARDTKATARQPVRYATFFLRGGWKGLPPVAAQLPPQIRDPKGSKPPYCGDPDCDEISRLRQREDDNGLRSLYPCPDCHPSRKDSAA
jgi:hypothetical protein